MNTRAQWNLFQIVYHVLAIWCNAWNGLAESGTTNREPRFADFPVNDVFCGKLRAVDLTSHPKAREYCTRLREASGKPANFAGHYRVVMWGCGTMCEAAALIDVTTGAVHFAPFTSALGSEYRLKSGLFVVDSRGGKTFWKGGWPGRAAAHFVRFEARRLDGERSVSER